MRNNTLFICWSRVHCIINNPQHACIDDGALHVIEGWMDGGWMDVDSVEEIVVYSLVGRSYAAV